MERKTIRETIFVSVGVIILAVVIALWTPISRSTGICVKKIKPYALELSYSGKTNNISKETMSFYQNCLKEKGVPQWLIFDFSRFIQEE